VHGVQCPRATDFLRSMDVTIMNSTAVRTLPFSCFKPCMSFLHRVGQIVIARTSFEGTRPTRPCRRRASRNRLVGEHLFGTNLARIRDVSAHAGCILPRGQHRSRRIAVPGGIGVTPGPHTSLVLTIDSGVRNLRVNVGNRTFHSRRLRSSKTLFRHPSVMQEAAGCAALLCDDPETMSTMVHRST